MVQKFLDKIVGDKKFLCIEILLKDGDKEYHAVEIVKNDNSLAIESSRTFHDLDSLFNGCSKNLPTLLSFTGHGIISKKVENITNYRSKLLFNANVDDFYWYEFPLSDHMYASVVRKNQVDRELAEFKKQQVFVVDVSIGPLVVATIKPLLPNVSSLHTRHHELNFQNNSLTGIAANPDVDTADFYELDGEKIRLKDILPFANLLNYLFPNPNIEAEKGFLESNRQEYKYRKAFNSIGMVALPSFLIALLVSYLFLNYYQNAYIDLQVELEEENIAYNKLVVLKNDRDSKEAMLNESGLNNSNFLSYYLSEITTEIPLDINLNEVGIFSPTAKIKPGQRIVFNNDQIEIRGATSSNGAFADWVKALKEYPWIENLEIVDFRKDGNTSNFEIRLKLQFNV